MAKNTGHRHWPEIVDDDGAVVCRCGRVIRRPERRPETPDASLEGEHAYRRLLMRLRAFWRP